MKRLMLMLLILAFVAGCGVSMTPQYRSELDKHVELMKWAVRSDRDGTLTPATQTGVLVKSYVILRTWQDAQTLTGVPTDPQAKSVYIDGLYAELTPATTRPAGGNP